MSGYENIKDKGFDHRTTEERRELAKIAGKKSGEARRKKADFRRTLNLLLTTEVKNEMTPLLDELGLESTLETAMLMAQIKEAMQGNTRAAYFVAEYAGQSPEPEENIRNREADTELKKARKQAVTGENETEEAIEKLDKILKGVYENAIKQETE